MHNSLNNFPEIQVRFCPSEPGVYIDLGSDLLKHQIPNLPHLMHWLIPPLLESIEQQPLPHLARLYLHHPVYFDIRETVLYVFAGRHHIV